MHWMVTSTTETFNISVTGTGICTLKVLVVGGGGGGYIGGAGSGYTNYQTVSVRPEVTLITARVGDRGEPSTVTVLDEEQNITIRAENGEKGGGYAGGNGYSGGGASGNSYGYDGGFDGGDGEGSDGGAGSGEDVTNYNITFWGLSPGKGGYSGYCASCSSHYYGGGGGGVLVMGAGPGDLHDHNGEGYGAGGNGGNSDGKGLRG